MTVLPIVERELRVAARRRATYRVRLGAAMVGIVIFGWMMLTSFLNAARVADRGLVLFHYLFGFAFVYCLLAGARLTADCLSEEKRDDTLGLLFLTDLRGYDVVLGKLVATSLNSFYGLLAILPVMALTTQLGGVTAGELVHSALVLLNTLFFSLAAGLCVSTVSRNERKAMFAALLAVLFATFGPLLLTFLLALYWPGVFENPNAIWPILTLSPAYSLWEVMFWSVPITPFPQTSFWWSLLLVHLCGWLCLSMASHILPRIWQRRAADSRLVRHQERIEQLAYGHSGKRSAFRRRLLDVNPFLWLAARQRWKHFYVWFYLAAVGGTWLWGWLKYGEVMMDRKTLVPTVLIFQVFLKIWMISEACSRLVEDRRSGALELLLSTPLTTSEILHGQWLALRRQFAGPLLVILLLEFEVLQREFAIETVFVNAGMLLADMVALGWIGMWMGLKARNTNRAILGGVTRVLILPWLAYYGAGMGLELARQFFAKGPIEWSFHARLYTWAAIGLLIDLGFGFLWARRGLVREFRAAAIERSGPETRGRFGWRLRRTGGGTVQAAVATL
ncbi:MAG TPA: ABC transporter permease subunit [Candidatus Nitrosotalea sp.]|nr:ABC transporter permease subunit [Candidatus Nitrosotalea sp.]